MKCRIRCPSCLKPTGEKQQNQHLFGIWAVHVHKWKRCFFYIPSLLIIVGVVIAVPRLAFRTEIPTLFPDDHNEVGYEAVQDLFASLGDVFGKDFIMPPLTEEVCRNFEFVRSCEVVWCETETELVAHDPGRCPCFRQESQNYSCGDATNVDFAVELSGVEDVDSQFQTSLHDFLLHRDFDTLPSIWNYAAEQRPSLLFNDWSTGGVVRGPLSELRGSAWRVWMNESVRNRSSCGWRDVCFCSQDVCSMGTEWKRTPHKFVLPSPGRLLAATPSARRIQASRGEYITGIFGVNIDPSVPLLGEFDLERRWTFLPESDFNLRDPWTQRALKQFCDELEDAQDLKVTQVWCWVQNFAECLRFQGMKFPALADEFDELAASCGTENQGTWVQDGVIKALRVNVKVSVTNTAPGKTVHSLRQAWDSHFEHLPEKVQGAFHISKLWTKVDSDDAVVKSTLVTLVIVGSLAFVGMLVFTTSLRLSIFVVISTSAVVCGLVFSVVIILQWEIGLVEGLAVIYFIGYAMTYSLHITHMYAGDLSFLFSAEELEHSHLWDSSTIRLKRTTFALKSIGGATLGSCITTAGASFFLVFCTLTVLQRLGLMCLTVTLISIAVSLGPLPAGLLLVGPLDPGLRCCKDRESELQAYPGPESQERGLEANPKTPTSPASRGSPASPKSANDSEVVKDI